MEIIFLMNIQFPTTSICTIVKQTVRRICSLNTIISSSTLFSVNSASSSSIVSSSKSSCACCGLGKNKNITSIEEENVKTSITLTWFLKSKNLTHHMIFFVKWIAAKISYDKVFYNIETLTSAMQMSWPSKPHRQVYQSHSKPTKITQLFKDFMW